MKKTLAFSFFVMFVIGTDTFLISPILPNLQQKFAVLPEFSGWMISAYALGYFLFALVAGPLSDRWNRKKVLLYGMLGFTVATFLCGTATSFWMMCLYRFLAGVCAAFASPQVWALLATLVPKEKLIRAMGLATAGLAFSQVIGVPLGSFLAQSNEALPFFALSLLSFLVLLAGVWFVPSLPPLTSGTTTSIKERYMALFQVSLVKSSFFGYFLLQLGGFAAFSYFGTWLHDAFALNNAGIGSIMVWLGVGNVVGSFSGGFFVRKFGQKTVLISAVFCVAALYLILPQLTDIRFVQIAYFLNFMMVGLLMPITMSLLQSLSTSARGTIASLTNATMYAATTLGSAFAGVLYVRWGGFVAVGLWATLCFLMSLAFFLRLMQHTQQASQQVNQQSILPK